MAEPVADGNKINTGAQKINRRAMAQGVGVHALQSKTGCCGLRAFGVSPQDVADSESGHRFAATIAEDRRGFVYSAGRSCKECL